MANARKYNLVMNSVISCGLGSYTGSTATCSLLNSFLMIYDTVPQTSYSYPQLTTEQLQTLSTLDYDKRVIDFLDYINIESGIAKEILFSGATTDEPVCSGYHCFLNQNFLVYKFLDGIRVVNVGSANGVIQYRVTGVFGSIYDSGWQNNGTFLGLDSNGMYDVVIRDYITDDDFVVCEYSKIISMPTLIPSTTITLAPKVISLYQITAGSSGPAVYKTGCIKINPSALSAGQKVQVTYTANVTLAGAGASCVQFTCKPNGSGSFVNYDCITNSEISPQTNSFTLCCGDTICYNLVAVAGTYGSNANANFCLTGVNGLGTTIPSIDITKCSSSVSSSQSALGVTVTLNRASGFSPAPPVCIITGTIGFTPAIPAGQCVTVGLSALTTSIGGNSNFYLYCKPSGGGSYLCVCSTNNTQLQPQLPTVIARNGDALCYCSTLTAPTPGTNACGRIGIINLTSSSGVSPIMGSPVSDSVSKVVPATPITLAVCRITSIGTSCGTGFINLSPALSSGQCVEACYQINQTANGVLIGMSQLNIYCKPNGGGSYLLACTFSTSSALHCSTPHGILTIRYGDMICYNNRTQGSAGSCSDICIQSITGSATLAPSICSTKCRDKVYV